MFSFFLPLLLQKSTASKSRKPRVKKEAGEENEETKDVKPKSKRKRNREGTAWYKAERICPMCGVILKAGGNHAIEKHIQIVHNREKSLQCEFCTEKFTYHEKLYAHQAKVHHYKSEQFCRECPPVECLCFFFV